MNRKDASRPAPTPWFADTTAPAREGVYQRRFPAGPYSCWSGDRWYGDARTPAIAAAARTPSPHQSAAWRGIDTPPDAACGTCRGHGVIDHGHDAEAGVDLIEECPECG